MSPISKLYLTVSTITVLGIQQGMKLGALRNVDSRWHWMIWLGGLVLSFAVLSKLILWIIGSSQWIKKKLLGPRFIEGTWVGCYKKSDETKFYSVEYFEQDLETITLRGASYDANFNRVAQWESLSIGLAPVNGKLTYSYSCNVHQKGGRTDGVGAFDLQRKSAKDAPYGLEGYAIDMNDSVQDVNTERKISDKNLDSKEAWQQARTMFG